MVNVSKSNFRLGKIEKNVPKSATRGSHNTEYAGHDKSSFSHFFSVLTIIS